MFASRLYLTCKKGVARHPACNRKHTTLFSFSLIFRLQENLTKAIDKNDALLEALETSEARALASAGDSVTSEVTLLRNLRARLAASHTPNSALRRDLPAFTGEDTCAHRKLQQQLIIFFCIFEIMFFY